MKLALAVSILVGTIAAASAGDGAALNVIGFSPDARHFAFEQYGANDGSALPFATIHVVDTVENEETDGAPFRRGVGEDFDGDARAEALSLARPAIERLQISHPATVLALNGLANPFEELMAMDIWPTMGRDVSELRFWSMQLGGEARLRVEQQQVEGGPCATMQSTRTVSANLHIRIGQGDEQPIYTDNLDPRTLDCPQAYGLVAIYRDDESSRFVAILSTYGLGFEGPNRRFRAIAWTASEPP